MLCLGGRLALSGTTVLTAKMTDCIRWSQLTADGRHNAYFCNECQLLHSGTGGGGTYVKGRGGTGDRGYGRCLSVA